MTYQLPIGILNFVSANEPARLSLYARLTDVLGPDEADTLMRRLPDDEAGELATKTDIARLEDRFDRLEDRFDRLEDRFDRLEDRFDRLGDTFAAQQRFYVGVTMATLTALTAVFSFVVSILV